MKRIVCLIFLCSVLFPAMSQSPGKFITPAPNDTITDGELFIVYQVKKDISFKASNADVYLDVNTNLKALVKINDHTVKVLLMQPVGKGEHLINIYLKDNEGEYYEDSLIIVARPAYSKQSLKADKTRKAFLVTGNVETYSKVNRFIGDTILSVEPVQTHYVNFTGEAVYKNIRFPVKLYATNQDNPSLQSRNRFLVGIQTPFIGALYGDVNPSYNTLVVNGSQVHGLDAYVNLNSMRIEYLRGTLNRNIEGRLLKYDILTGLPPVNMRPDSTYVTAGTYKRDITAFNVIFKGSPGHSDVRVTFAKSTDDSTSIRYGGNVAQNAVLGFLSQSCSKSDAFRLNFGAAISVTTNDIRQGLMDKDTLLARTGIDFDPAEYKNIIIINYTTTPLTFKNLPSLCYFAEGRYHKKKFGLTMKYQRVGSAFQSFANPYIIKDRRLVSIDNKNVLLKNKLTLMFEYRFYRNNLDKIEPLTQHTNMYGGKVSFAPAASFPRLYFSYRLTLRNSVTNAGIDSISLQIHNIVVGLGKEFTTGPFSHSVNVNYSKMDNVITKPAKTSQNNSTVNFSITERHTSGMFVSLSYLTNLVAIDTARLSLNNNYAVQVGYGSRDNKLIISANTNLVKAKQLSSSESSNYYQMGFNIQYVVMKNSRIMLQGGYSSFDDKSQPLYNYKQIWAVMQLSNSF
jgi:hypothetical protein